MAVKALNIPVVKLPVSNLEKSVAFYSDVLGLGFSFEYSPGDNEAWMNVGGGIGLGLIRTKAVPKLDFYNMKGEAQVIFEFLVDQIHDAYEEIKAKGVDVGDIKYNKGGGHSFLFRDPDEHVLAVWGGWPKEEEE